MPERARALENLDVARELTLLADLLEIQGANPFRIRAYRNAVNTVEGLSRPLHEMVAAGEDLSELPAIGDNVAAHIVELLQTGSIDRLREVEAQFPRSLVELMALEGLGPKKARKLFEELGVRTIAELADALDSGAVEKLEGFGEKSVAKLRHALADHRKHTGRLRLDEVEHLIAGLLEHMRSAPGAKRVEVAGSVRRRRETIGDVDLLVEAEGDGTPIVEHFTAFDGAVRAEAAGPTKGSIVLGSGLQVDLRVVPRKSYGAALVYFTGSKDHNVAIRTRAVRDRIRVSEWGVFRVPKGVDPASLGPTEGKRLAGETEESVYEALGLDWIPPELRENRGEVEAAAAGELPRLVTLQDIRGDLQMHSTWSDGKASIEVMARMCVERGYEYLAITDHSGAMAMLEGLDPKRARRQWKEVEKLKKSLPEIDILRSAEVDILKDGTLDMPDDVLEELDLVLISIHSFFDQDKKRMTDRVLKAMSHPTVDILGHPTGRQINKREPIALDVEAMLEAAADLSVAVELNANPRRLDLSDAHVHRAKELGVPVVISTDAHGPAGLDDMRYGVDQARRAWLGPADVLNTRSAKQLRKWLARKPA
jgi:DNA polymerase (family 10)